jgi:hypothetical protein
MGCWNHTCAVTNLPIYAGEEVEVILLKAPEMPDAASYCYPYVYHSPLPLTFHGKYDDYGAVEECEGAALDIIIDGIREDLVEMEQGENQYHDIPAKKETFNVEQLFELDHEDRLFVKNRMAAWDKYPDTLAIKHIVVRKAVYDEITTNFGIERWNRETSEEYYIKLTDLDYDVYTQDIDNILALPEDSGTYSYLRYAQDEIRGDSELSKIISSYGRSIYGLTDPINVNEILITLREEKSDLYDAVLVNAARFAIFSHYMDDTRKSWHVPSGLGSQNQNTYGQELTAKLILSEVDKIKHFWDEE